MLVITLLLALVCTSYTHQSPFQTQLNELDLQSTDFLQKVEIEFSPSSQLSFMEIRANSDSDEGEDSIDGDLEYLLVTSFSEVTENSGKVWVIPSSSRSDTWGAYTLITGLIQPVAVCFDINHNYLYVVDTGYDEGGHIWQYVIDWDQGQGDLFTLRNSDPVDIYTGQAPSDCALDEYGNLYFLETSKSAVNTVNYIDLWTGYYNAYYTLYERNAQHTQLNSPVALDVIASTDIWVVNNQNGTTDGLLILAYAQSRYMNQGDIEALVYDYDVGWGVTSDSDYVYYSIDQGEVWAFDIKNNKTSLKASGFYSPRGLCYGDGYVFVVDEGMQEVYRLKAGDSLETEHDAWVAVKGAYDVYCVNWDDWAVALELTLVIMSVI